MYQEANMFKFLLTIILFTTTLPIYSEVEIANENYDAKLAKKLGADDYGMKSYVFVTLKSGSNTSTDTDQRSTSFRGHLKNIRKLVAENKLLIAGPFGQNDSDFRGLFILNVTTIKEAEKLLESDPAIKAGYLKADLYEWYGSAALSEYLSASDKVWKIKP